MDEIISLFAHVSCRLSMFVNVTHCTSNNSTHGRDYISLFAHVSCRLLMFVSRVRVSRPMDEIISLFADVSCFTQISFCPSFFFFFAPFTRTMLDTSRLRRLLTFCEKFSLGHKILEIRIVNLRYDRVDPF